MKQAVVALHKGVGWKSIELDVMVRLQKSWDYDGETYRVDVYFGRLTDRERTPVVIMNVYRQGAATREVIDDNFDVWNNLFVTTSTEDGNEFFKYLKKHGFVRN